MLSGQHDQLSQRPSEQRSGNEILVREEGEESVVQHLRSPAFNGNFETNVVSPSWNERKGDMAQTPTPGHQHMFST